MYYSSIRFYQTTINTVHGQSKAKTFTAPLDLEKHKVKILSYTAKDTRRNLFVK